MKWIEPSGSVLDELRNDIESSIANAEGLDELIALYQAAQTRVEEY